MSNIKLIALGGVRENGKNLYIAEVDESIFVLDVGNIQKMNSLVWILLFQIWTICLKIRTVLQGSF